MRRETATGSGKKCRATIPAEKKGGLVQTGKAGIHHREKGVGQPRVAESPLNADLQSVEGFHASVKRFEPIAIGGGQHYGTEDIDVDNVRKSWLTVEMTVRHSGEIRHWLGSASGVPNFCGGGRVTNEVAGGRKLGADVASKRMESKSSRIRTYQQVSPHKLKLGGGVPYPLAVLA